MKSINIAVTGLNATNNPAPGLNIIKSIKAEKGLRTKIIGLTYDLLFTGVYESSLLDEVYVTPYPVEGEATLLSRLIEINRLTRLDVIIPSVDSEVILYSSLKSELRNLGMCMLIPDMAKVQTRSKQVLPEFCRDNNINTPTTKTVYDFRDIKNDTIIGYPSVLKGSFTDAQKVDSMEEAEVFFGRLAKEWGLPLIWQKFILGEEYDVVALTDENSNTIGKVAIKKFAITEKGKAWSGVTVGDKSILALSDDILKSLRWTGPLELELMKESTSGKFYLLEINPRFPTWVYLAAMAGQNLPAAAVKLALGKKVKPFYSYDLGKLFIRSVGDSICRFEVMGNLSVHGNIIYHNHKISSNLCRV